jgi:glycine betaine/proline transport system ATP-binding protein
MNPLNVLRGTSLMTPAISLRRELGAVLLDRDGRVKIQVDHNDHPIGVTLDGRQGRLVALNGEARPSPAAAADIVVASVDLKLRDAIELRRATGNPVVLVDQLGCLAGLCGDEEIYRGLLRRDS